MNKMYHLLLIVVLVGNNFECRAAQKVNNRFFTDVLRAIESKNDAAIGAAVGRAHPNDVAALSRDEASNILAILFEDFPAVNDLPLEYLLEAFYDNGVAFDIPIDFTVPMFLTGNRAQLLTKYGADFKSMLGIIDLIDSYATAVVKDEDDRFEYAQQLSTLLNEYPQAIQANPQRNPDTEIGPDVGTSLRYAVRQWQVNPTLKTDDLLERVNDELRKGYGIQAKKRAPKFKRHRSN